MLCPLIGTVVVVPDLLYQCEGGGGGGRPQGPHSLLHSPRRAVEAPTGNN